MGEQQLSAAYDKIADFVEALRTSAEFWPDLPAFTYLLDGDSQSVSVTFAELDRGARAVAAHLVGSGLSGERALLLYPSGLDFVVALFGCFYANVVAIPAFPPRRNRNMLRLQAICEDAHAGIALTVNDVSQRLGPELNDAANLSSVRWVATDTLDLAAADDWVKPQIDPTDVAILQYTSGSTGHPKGVILSHQSLLANCRLITSAFEAKRGAETIMTWLPTYHDMGLIGGVLEPVYTASSVHHDVADGFLAKAGSMVGSDQSLQGDGFRRTQFRLRPVCQESVG